VPDLPVSVGFVALRSALPELTLGKYTYCVRLIRALAQHQ
jgi:hypothetical protein